MIHWADQMYYDWLVKKRKKRVRHAIEAGKTLVGVYCIALASNPENLFDIINANELKFSYYRNQDIYMVGLAWGRESAMELVAVIIDEVYQNTGDVKVREYYRNRWKVC